MVRKIQGIIAIVIILFAILQMPCAAQATTNQQQYIYDEAGLLTTEEKQELEQLAQKLSAEDDTAYVILTVNGTNGKGIETYMGDFYDNKGLGYNKKHGNTAILSLDMQERDVYLAGFKKARVYLNADRLTKVRQRVTPALSEGDYYDAFRQFIEDSHYYMGTTPPGILYQWWFQIGVGLLLATIIVGAMAYNRGGKMTATERNYFNATSPGIIKKEDRFIRTMVTKTKKPSNNSSGGGGGGGGRTGGGHSYSGSGGKF